MAMNYTAEGPVGGVAFLVLTAPTQDPGASSGVTVVWSTEVFDVGANFASNTFTAPVTGKYLFNWIISLQVADAATSSTYFTLTTSNRTFLYLGILDPDGLTGGSSHNYFPMNGSLCCDMDASDTAYLQYYWNLGTGAESIRDQRYFSGHLVA